MAQDVLMCIQTGKTLDDPRRMKFETQEFYIKSEDEMRALFPEHPGGHRKHRQSGGAVPDGF